MMPLKLDYAHSITLRDSEAISLSGEVFARISVFFVGAR